MEDIVKMLLREKSMYEKKVSEVLKYTPPIYHEGKNGKDSYIHFYAYHPEQEKMVRKKIHLNRVKSVKTRKEFANRIIENLNEELKNGWNPFIDLEKKKTYTNFDEGCNVFLKTQIQLEKSGVLRSDTLKSYKIGINLLKEYNANSPQPIKYLFQFTKEYIKDYLEYLFLKKNNKAVTVNSRLTIIHLFCAYLVEKNYLQVNPATTIKKYKVDIKTRTVIDDKDLMKINDYLNVHNKPFLLALYLIYYCFIRPKELGFLFVSCVNFEKNTITIDAKISKNRKTATVTLPKKVKELMIDLGVDKSYKNNYLIGNKFVACNKQIKRNVLSNYFRDVRKKLELPDNYQLYSLKDTGITDMVKNNFNPLSIRNQARHHSIAMTNKYVEEATDKSNVEIENSIGNF